MSHDVRIHIVCPGDQVNGSAESLHQFGRAAATAGHDARIAYEPFDVLGPVVSAFRSYGLRNDQDVPDDPDVVVLVPHTAVDLVAHLNQAQVLVWWLRVDDEADVAAVTAAVPHATHLAQSEHARRFLDLHGMTATVLGDYVHPDFIERARSLEPMRRLDTVLYNPDPTDEVTPRLIEASRGVLDWVPVERLSRNEVAEIMAYSKVYVDFGAHAGRTRLPREALAVGCCVITGRRGAAGNGTDLDTPDGFSFDESSPDVVKDALNRVALTVMEFDDADRQFSSLRATVAEQQQKCRADIGRLLGSIDAPADMGAGPDPAGMVELWAL